MLSIHGLTREVLDRANAWRQKEAAVADSAAAVSGLTSGSNHNATESLLVVAVGDLIRSAAFTQFLLGRDARFKQGVGKWRDVQERAFIIRADDYEKDPDAFAPWLKGQEAVLFLGPAFRDGKLYGNRRAWLLDVNERGEIWQFPATYLGLYGWVGNTQPAGDWTYNPESGFFAIEPAAVETVYLQPGVSLDTSADSPWPTDGNSPTTPETRTARVARGSDRYA